MGASANAAEALRREQAWLGDAVLGLYCREWLLAHPPPKGFTRDQLYQWMTGNAFLSAFGEPTSVEATIGQIYREGGLTAAFAHIEAQLLPLFHKQLQRRLRGGS